MVIFQKLNKSSVDVPRFLNTRLSKILKIKIISKFTSSAIQRNIRTTGDSNEMSDDQSNDSDVYWAVKRCTGSSHHSS
jgi:hypothetical protein